MEICCGEYRILYKGCDDFQTERYFMLGVNVPSESSRLHISIARHTAKEAQIPVALFDSNGQMRIFRAPEGASGDFIDSYCISPDEATSGAVSGAIPEGEWKLVLYKRRFSESFSVVIKVDAEKGKPDAEKHLEAKRFTFSSQIFSSSPGWYRGELHVHSSESTGRRNVEEVLEAAERASLDFIAITDHFTSSHWHLIEEAFKKHSVLCLQSMEVSGDRGHANVHGLTDWINPLVDDNEKLSAFLNLSERPSMSGIADHVHKMGGLFGINHPLSGMVGWQYADFPMEKADLIDLWAAPDGATSLCYPSLYDTYLVQGYRIIGVGSSDSHDPNQKEGPWRFGQLYTYVYADSLSSDGIISGLKRGRVYVACGESRMDMGLSYKGHEYMMGESLHYSGGDAMLHISMESNPSGNLFVMISGQLHSVHYIEASEDMKQYDIVLLENDIHMLKSGFAFVRVEFFEDVVKARFWGMAHRDYGSMRLLSNPVWLVKEE